MARYNRYKDEKPNSTVSWVPSFLRDFLGLNSTYERPEYGTYGNTREDAAQSTIGWIPGFIRRWLGLEYTEPTRYPPSTAETYDAPAYTPPRQISRADVDYSRSTESGRMSFSGDRSASYRPTTSTSQGLPPDPAPRSGTPVAPGSAGLPAEFGEIASRPITHLLRGYSRGALPPQGLEHFTRDLRATLTDLGNFYNYWINFQTEDFRRTIDNFRNPPSVQTRTPATKTGTTVDLQVDPPSTTGGAPGEVSATNTNLTETERSRNEE